MKVTLDYEYSTKNMHRYSTRAGVVNEVYIHRLTMAQPVAQVNLDVDWNNQPTVVEKAKPARG